MTEIEYRQSIANIVYLCRCAVNGTKPQADQIAAFDLDHLYLSAKRHMLASMVGLVLKKQGISTARFENAIALAQRQAVILDQDLKEITSALEAAGIWYMPLKGAVLKHAYPQFAMREMCDHDILFDEAYAEKVRIIMTELAFQVKSYGISSHDAYIKPPVSYFEMHRRLFGDMHDQKLYEYYSDVKARLLKDEDNGYGYHFSPEDFYVYMIAHEYKHFCNGGTGLRSLLDSYVYLHAAKLKMEYLAAEIEKLGIVDFERKNRELSLALFDGESLTEEQEKMFDYIAASGSYGTIKHAVENKVAETSKLRYIARRVFGPLGKDDPFREQFKQRYAAFFNYPILLPFLPFYRLFRAIRSDPKRIKAEASALRKAGKTVT